MRLPLLLAVVLVAGCTGGGHREAGPTPAQAPDTTVSRLSAGGKLRVGIAPDEPGFGVLAPGKAPVGFDVEIAKLVARALHVPDEGITWTPASSTSREKLLSDGAVDLVVATYPITTARREQVGFAGPYLEAGQALLVRTGDAAITGPAALRTTRARVCAVTGTEPAAHVLTVMPRSQLRLADVYSQCAAELRSGAVRAITGDLVTLLGLVAAESGRFALVDERLTSEPLGIGLRKGDTAFCAFIDDVLAQAGQDGSYARAWSATAGLLEPTVPALPTPEPCSP